MRGNIMIIQEGNKWTLLAGNSQIAQVRRTRIGGGQIEEIQTTELTTRTRLITLQTY